MTTVRKHQTPWGVVVAAVRQSVGLRAGVGGGQARHLSRWYG